MVALSWGWDSIGQGFCLLNLLVKPLVLKFVQAAIHVRVSEKQYNDSLPQQGCKGRQTLMRFVYWNKVFNTCQLTTQI